MSMLRNALAALVFVPLMSCAQSESGVQSANWWVPYNDTALKPHYRAVAMPWCSPKADFGFSAWNAPTAEAAVSKAIAVCKMQTEPRYLQDGTCQLCRISDTDLRGLSQQKIEGAITVYETDTSATSYDMVGRANPPSMRSPFVIDPGVIAGFVRMFEGACQKELKAKDPSEREDFADMLGYNDMTLDDFCECTSKTIFGSFTQDDLDRLVRDAGRYEDLAEREPWKTRTERGALRCLTGNWPA